MSLRSRVRSLWRNVMQRDRMERELDEELRALFELLVEEKVGRGLPRWEARRAAAIELGGIEPVKERVRDVKIGLFVETLLQDVRHAVRHLQRSPGFATAALLTLALGIGANTAMFSVLNALTWRRLAIPDPDGLIGMSSYNERGQKRYVPFPIIHDLTRESPFHTVCGHNAGGIVPVEANNRPAQAVVAFISGRCFETFGVMPMLGRPITDDDAPLTTGGKRVVVIGHRLWRRLFDADPDVLGRSIRAEGVEVTIVGVLPESFYGIQADSGVDIFAPPDTIIPASAERRPVASEVLGRLKPGVTIDQASAELRVSWPALLEDARRGTQQASEGLNLVGTTIRLERLGTGLSPFRERYSSPVSLILGLTSLLLLLACVNLGGLLLTRLTARGSELGLRLALGGSRGRIAQQMVVENVVLSLAATALAVPVSLVFTARLASFIPPTYIDRAMSFTPDLRVLGVTAIGGLAAGIVLAALPSWFAMQRRASIQFGTSRTVARSTSRWTQGLLVTQVALSFVLMISSALLARSLYHLQHADVGVRTSGIINAKLLTLPGGQRGPTTKRITRS